MSQSYGGRELAAAFRTVRKNTIQIANEIPEDKYTFVAAPGAKPVGEMLLHIAYTSDFHEDLHRTKRVTTLAGYDFPAAVGAWRAHETTPHSKAEIIAILESKGEAFASWLETLTPEFLAETYTDPTGQNARTRFEGLLSPKEHEMHHRGQLMLIERMLGVTPHLTRIQMERNAARAAAAAKAS